MFSSPGIHLEQRPWCETCEFNLFYYGVFLLELCLYAQASGNRTIVKLPFTQSQEPHNRIPSKFEAWGPAWYVLLWPGIGSAHCFEKTTLSNSSFKLRECIKFACWVSWHPILCPLTAHFFSLTPVRNLRCCAWLHWSMVDCSIGMHFSCCSLPRYAVEAEQNAFQLLRNSAS